MNTSPPRNRFSTRRFVLHVGAQVSPDKWSPGVPVLDVHGRRVGTIAAEEVCPLFNLVSDNVKADVIPANEICHTSLRSRIPPPGHSMDGLASTIHSFPG